MQNTEHIERFRLKQVRDLSVFLKDLEPYVKNPNFLRRGREFQNFRMRPREALANWLLCIVFKSYIGKDLTLAEDPDSGDGLILERVGCPVVPFYTEHVFVGHHEEGDINEVILDKIASKLKRGPVYTRGRNLIVFSEKVGLVKAGLLRLTLGNKNDFVSIILVGLERSDKDGYIYWITRLSPIPSLWSYRIFINWNFDKWRVERVR